MLSFNNTPAEFRDILDSFHNREVSDETKKEYRYVIYVRKSTDDKEKQVRSLTDQIIECQEFADRIDIKIAGIIQEAESAKQPDTRPRFREMIQGLQSGKYDGILAWHPDRLARNMKDAGEIIDMVDKSIIKDLKFVSFNFEDTPSGKMLLGITFVLSKEYSDKLSENVSRGNNRSIDEGKYINKAKHGYYKDSNQYLRPDGNNFILIKNAFVMRADGKTLDEIAKYLNTNGYSRSNVENSKRYYKMDVQKVSKFITDPVYTGVLIYGKKVVNLMELYDFAPAVSVEVFRRINKLDTDKKYLRLARSYHKDENVKANLMRQMVICGSCNEYLDTGLTSKKKSPSEEKYYYYYFRCENGDCKMNNKSVRAYVILDFIKHYLSTKPFSNETAYKSYKKEMELTIEQRSVQTKSDLLSLQIQKTRHESKFIKTKEFLVNNPGEQIKKHYMGDLEKIKEDIKAIELKIKEKTRLLEHGDALVLTYENFLELLEKMPINMGYSKNLTELDYMIKKVFLNFTVHKKKVVKFKLNTPFDTFATSKVALGAR